MKAFHFKMLPLPRHEPESKATETCIIPLSQLATMPIKLKYLKFSALSVDSIRDAEVRKSEGRR